MVGMAVSVCYSHHDCCVFKMLWHECQKQNKQKQKVDGEADHT